MNGNDNQADYHRMAALRTFFTRYVATRGAAGDPRIEAAFAAVPREPFAGPGPGSILCSGPWRAWPGQPSYTQTPGNDPAFLYQDTLVALDVARGINIGEPSLHAHCLDALAPQPGEVVVQVGVRSGYYTAILTHLVGLQGRVHAFEVDPVLTARASHNLMPWPQAMLHVRSGTADGLPEAEAIYVNAGITQPGLAGRSAPRRPAAVPAAAGGRHRRHVARAQTAAWRPSLASPVRVPCGILACQARQDAATGRGLTAAFAGGGWEDVQVLRLNGKPDDTCWFNGADWWPSTAPA